MRKPTRNAAVAARELATIARRSGVLAASDLDDFLAGNADFEERVEALLRSIGDVPPAEFEEMYRARQQSQTTEVGLN